MGSEKEKTATAVAALQSKDHKALLDTIDKLRSKGISQYVDLPQIVVCGDQSSGKSSVLQAVSNMSFPMKDNLCTRFATELILRHVTGVIETCKITIQPGSDRTDEEKSRLREFQKTDSTKEIDIGRLIESAKEIMRLDDHSKRFSSDVLRIEISGPTQPNLTIVDLPGLFRAGNKDQTADDAEIVNRIVQSYMTNSLSIILAVVSAKSDFALQEVTQLARKINVHGVRTIGLITKPDTLDVGSDSERAYHELAQNRDVHFRLGWHVLRNRDYKSRDSTNGERDQAEDLFFSQGVWAAVARKNKGVTALRSRLSEVLTSHILEELPALLHSVETELKECSFDLEKLGTSRNTISEQRNYLLQSSYHFATIIKDSITGTYNNEFFGSAFEPEGGMKRFRAVLQSTLAEFAEAMRVDGHAKQVVDRHREGGSREILRADYLKQVQSLMRASRGCELPGTFNPAIIGALFQQQSKPWQGILSRYSEKILDAASCTIDAVLSHVVDFDTRSKLWQELIAPELDQLKDTLNKKMSEILASHTSGHPITYNHYLIENVQRAQNQRVREKMRARLQRYSDANGILQQGLTVDSLINILVERDTEADMEIFASSRATDIMLAYYKVALKRVIDDFGDLVIEACLVSRLPDLFSPGRVSTLNDSQIECIAGESVEITEDRAAFSAKKNALEECLSEIRRLVKLHQHHQRQLQRQSLWEKDTGRNTKASRKSMGSLKSKSETVSSKLAGRDPLQSPSVKSSPAVNPTTSTASLFPGNKQSSLTTSIDAVSSLTTTLFGDRTSSTQNKPAFGASTTGTTGGGLFGGGGTTTSFGSGNAFNAPANTALGAPVGDAPGTATTAFSPTLEKESIAGLAQNSYQSILFQEPYKKWSAEELRLADYAQNRRFGSGFGPTGQQITFFGAGSFGTNPPPSASAANTHPANSQSCSTPNGSGGWTGRGQGRNP
ncbi:hypothetical protein PFICI_01126 [Pestalotiopsis fici W106-1]|uniref:GED domain-containing protein n=1 Tax=Pestalotiopsis fici (strain W106-1 / CGMCC3.15140) TaxID=1229662 RepID=W3XMN1_PESFW|nr:uncharacterized protein PFICI_01126 [Pestalotiopsis fici W106-1]ETS87298.1 hypothetical protein PFICI_01126 [Pestalotiopsis fici W106-1]